MCNIYFPSTFLTFKFIGHFPRLRLKILNYFPQNKKGPICGHVTLIRCKTCNILGVLQRISVTCPQIGPPLHQENKKSDFLYIRVKEMLPEKKNRIFMYI